MGTILTPSTTWIDTVSATPVQPLTLTPDSTQARIEIPKKTYVQFLNAVQRFNRDFAIKRLNGPEYLGEVFFERDRSESTPLPAELRNSLMMAIYDISKRNLPNRETNKGKRTEKGVSITENNINELLAKHPGLPTHYTEGTPMEHYLRDFRKNLHEAIDQLPEGEGSLREMLCMVGEAAQRSNLFAAIAGIYSQPSQVR